MILPPQSNTLKPPITGATSGVQGNLRQSPRDGGNSPWRSLQVARRQLGLKIWPDNSATLSYFGPRSPKRVIDRPIDPATDEAKAIAPLGLSSETKSRIAKGKTTEPKGRKGITSYGKKMVRSMVCLLEQMFSRRCLSFGTATLPPMSASDMAKVQHCWAIIVNRFFEELARHFKRAGQDFLYVHCTEIQPRRWLARREVGLHIHWLCVGRPSVDAKWTIAPHEVAAIWARVLGRVLGYEPDTSKATRVEVPKKSVKRELAKYLSKGCAVIKQIIDAGQGDRLPNAWWGGLTALKREVHKSIIVYGSRVAKSIRSCLEDLREVGFWNFSHIFRTATGISTESGLWVATAIHFRCDYGESLAYLISNHYSFSSPQSHAISPQLCTPEILGLLSLDKLLRGLLS